MIFYFSGTGNSFEAARTIASITHDQLVDIGAAFKEGRFDYIAEQGTNLGFVFPTHCWSTPRIVDDFLAKLIIMGPNGRPFVPGFSFVVVTCGGFVGNTARFFEKLLWKNQGIRLDSSFSIQNVDNCIFLMSPGSTDKQKKLQRQAHQAARQIGYLIDGKRITHQEKRNVFGSLMSTVTCREGKNFSTSKFTVDADVCIHCGQCEQLCPMGTITLVDAMYRPGNEPADELIEIPEAPDADPVANADTASEAVNADVPEGDSAGEDELPDDAEAASECVAATQSELADDEAAECTAEDELEIDSAIDAETEDGVEAENNVESESDVEAEIAAEDESGIETADDIETEIDVVDEAETTEESESEAAAGLEAEGDAEADTESYAEADTESYAEADTESDAEAKTDIETESELDLETELGAFSEAQSESQTPIEIDEPIESHFIPVWHTDGCTWCMACIQRCPTQAIQFGKSTKNRARYTHPILAEYPTYHSAVAVKNVDMSIPEPEPVDLSNWKENVPTVEPNAASKEVWVDLIIEPESIIGPQPAPVSAPDPAPASAGASALAPAPASASASASAGASAPAPAPMTKLTPTTTSAYPPVPAPEEK